MRFRNLRFKIRGLIKQTLMYFQRKIYYFSPVEIHENGKWKIQSGIIFVSNPLGSTHQFYIKFHFHSQEPKRYEEEDEKFKFMQIKRKTQNGSEFEVEHCENGLIL